MRKPKEIIIDGKSLEQILKDHQHWIYKDCKGWISMRADLVGADLHEADLRGANLFQADLVGADLRFADLYGANLCATDLYGANLYGADLYGANLCEAAIWGAKSIPSLPYVCPDFGSFTGFKKAIGRHNNEEITALITLEILEDARRSSGTTRKCRCDKAKVLRITDLDEKFELTEAYSNFNKSFYYRVGEIVSVNDFYPDRWNECSEGIHFFINKQEAIDYE